MNPNSKRRSSSYSTPSHEGSPRDISAPSTPRGEETRLIQDQQLDAGPSHLPAPDPWTRPQMSTPTRPPQKAKGSHIPRPPNAFMLFRSDLLSRNTIPFTVERRQQKLSSVAGQCWNLLSQEEKEIWEDKAKQVLAEHLKRYPDYKYTPSPRGSRRPKTTGSQDTSTGTADGEDRIRKIREDYLHILGPPASPAKRSRRKIQDRDRESEAGPVTTTPRSSAPEVSSPPSLLSQFSDHEDNRGILLSPLTPFSPQHLLPQVTVTPSRSPMSPELLPPPEAEQKPKKRVKFSLSDLLNPMPESKPITPLPSTRSELDTNLADHYLPTLDESFRTFLPVEDFFYDSETIDGTHSASPSSSKILSAIPLPMLTLEDYSPLSDFGELDLSEFDQEWNTSAKSA